MIPRVLRKLHESKVGYPNYSKKGTTYLNRVIILKLAGVFLYTVRIFFGCGCKKKRNNAEQLENVGSAQ